MAICVRCHIITIKPIELSLSKIYCRDCYTKYVIDGLKGSIADYELLGVAPIDIYNYLNNYVVGQHDVKKKLSVAVYNHLKTSKLNTGLGKSNMVLLGPTGSGKTFLITKLAQYLKVPCIIFDAQRLTGTGWQGGDIEDIFSNQEHIENLSEAIVYLDEIDKISSQYKEHSFNSLEVQAGLLRLLEDNGSISYRKNRMDSNLVTLDTSKMLFIIGGAFEKLKVKNNEKSIGFTNNVDIQDNEFKNVTHEDIINYGFLTEFIARFPVIGVLNKLVYSDYREILVMSENSLVNRYCNFFKTEGKTLDITSTGLDEIAKQALELNLGARALESVMSKLFFEDIYNISNDTNYILLTQEEVKKRMSK